MIPPDAVAAGIVQAWRETGEDPICAAMPAVGSSFRARHYAMWALIHVFNARPKLAADLVGGAGVNFFNGSRQNAIKDRRPGGGGWWDEAAYTRVIAAVENRKATVPTPEPGPAREEPPPFKHGELPPVRRATDGGVVKTMPRSPVGTLEPGGFRPAAGTYERELRSSGGMPRTSLDRFADRSGRPRDYDAGGDDQLQSRAYEQKKCRDILAEAAANTAKLQAKMPKEKED